jgi:hypothetical protein
MSICERRIYEPKIQEISNWSKLVDTLTIDIYLASKLEDNRLSELNHSVCLATTIEPDNARRCTRYLSVDNANA